jgi:DNA-binding transcriptional MerR regulator
MLVLKIGEFSQLSQVTVKTLHHYDEMDLLKPAHIDRFTNYRYYTLEQLPRVHRIMALKELGLSLEQIGLMLDEEMPDEQIRGMLRLKRAEAKQQMREVRQQLAMIEFRLRMVEAETDFPELDVVVKQLEPIHCLSFFVPRPPTVEAGWQQMAQVANAVREAIANGVLKTTGVSVDKFYGSAFLESSNYAFDRHEVLLPVTKAQEDVELGGIGRLTVKEEPPAETAVTLMVSAKETSYLDSVEKVTLVRRWAAEHGYRSADYIRFYNFRGPPDTLNPDEFLFEAQLPVTPA